MSAKQLALDAAEVETVARRLRETFAALMGDRRFAAIHRTDARGGA
jgi:hypothetical protein